MKYLFLVSTRNIESISPIPVDEFFSGGILETVQRFFGFIFIFFKNILSALFNFYDVLIGINDYVVSLGDSALDGVSGGLPVIDAIGLYRYIVTDPVFYFTYVLVVAGCLFTIYKLVILLIQAFKSLKDSITGNGKTGESLMKSILKAFK